MNKELEANIFMDWMFNSEEKIKPFNHIIENMKEVYLADSKPWVISVSFGKDSSLTLYLAWKMLGSLKESECTKLVYVIIPADTKVEMPYMS